MASRSLALNTLPVVVRRRARPVRRAHRPNTQWKVAYADFSTAMMAFFMLLWLMSNSDKVSLQGLADYFAPSNATMSNSSGAGAILSGAAMGPDGAKANGSLSPDAMSANARMRAPLGYGREADGEARDFQAWPIPATVTAEMRRRDEEVRTALEESPDLAMARDSLVLETTPEAFRIQLIDTVARPMFQSGGAAPTADAAAMLRGIARKLPGQGRIAVEGHTDSAAKAGAYGNWELSADRATAARRVLAAAGVTSDRIAGVAGRGSSEPLYPDEPWRAENRRITVLLLREAPLTPVSLR